MAPAVSYTLEAVALAIVAVAIDWWVTRSRVVRTASFWITWVVVAAFQIPVDGALTRLRAPVVEYRSGTYLGIRLGHAIPIEDFVYGFALVLVTISLWVRFGRRASR